MKFPSRPISLFLLATESWSATAFRPLSFGSRRREVTSLTRNHGVWSTKPEQGKCLLMHHLAGQRTSAVSGVLTTRGGATSLSTSALNSAVAALAETETPVEIFRKDYEPLPHVVSKIEMDFDIHDGKTTVTSRLFIEPNKSYQGKSTDLTLDGDETCVKLLSLKLNGKDLEQGKDFELAPGKLVLKNPPSGSTLTSVVEIVPEDNTQLSGLYKSGSMYCTQCEALGFRRITYYPDRPDNMATFTSVRLEAEKEKYPVLLSNGNLVEEGTLENGRHFATWSDPFPKPSYLFCCVAGDLGKIEDTYTTVPSGREVKLAVYSEPRNVGKLGYAMESLKRSMKWDEDKFGLEYDLDIYNVVAGKYSNRKFNLATGNSSLECFDES
jgi:aminopeptidase N